MTARQLRDWLNTLPQSFLDSAEIQAGRHLPASAKRVIAYQWDEASGVAVNPMGEHLSDEFFKQAKILSIIGCDGEIDVDNLPVVQKAPTPRTDAERFYRNGSLEYVTAEFARQLETELTALQSAHDTMENIAKGCTCEAKNAEISVLKGQLAAVTKERDDAARTKANAIAAMDKATIAFQVAEAERAGIRQKLGKANMNRKALREKLVRVRDDRNELRVKLEESQWEHSETFTTLRQWKACADLLESDLKTMKEVAERIVGKKCEQFASIAELERLKGEA